MNILIVTPGYPTKRNSAFSFVKQLVDEWTRQNHHCYVLCPNSISHGEWRFKERKCAIFENGGSVTEIRPNYLSFSHLNICGVNVTSYMYSKAIKRGLAMLNAKIDVVYCHFWKTLPSIFSYATDNNIPIFVASGESSISDVSSSILANTQMCKNVSGVICVSTKNRDESISLGLTTKNECAVFPNSVNVSLFTKLDKMHCRERLGFPKDKFIVAYVGWFDERKGAKRLSDALEKLEDSNVYSIFIGKGEKEPTCNNILFKGSLPHEKIPEYLNSADIFVLPTLKEGCCNAVVEAMACGLPIVSSNLSFNWDILNEDNSIMINPMNVDEISEAIAKLRNDVNLRNKLSEGALDSANALSISQRASNIIDFIKSKLNIK